MVGEQKKLMRLKSSCKALIRTLQVISSGAFPDIIIWNQSWQGPRFDELMADVVGQFLMPSINKAKRKRLQPQPQYSHPLVSDNLDPRFSCQATFVCHGPLI